MRNMNRILGLSLTALVLGAVPASAQLANASATTLGLAGSATASARGIAALSVNPAGLAMPGSGFTLAIVPLQVRPGLSPITAKDLKDVQGDVLPGATKQQWLTDVTAAGSQTGSFGVEVSPLALSVGHFGVQVSTLASGQVDMSPQIVELLLYGNAGKTGTAQTFTLSGSSLTGFAATTVGASVGIPLHTSTGAMAVGATLKYVMGNGLILGQNSTGSFTPDKITFNFPMIMTNDDGYSATSNGSGLGIDLGFQSKRDKLGLGVSVQNVINTFSWDESSLSFRPVTGSIDSNAQTTDVEKQPIANAPAGLKSALNDMKFKPIIGAGASYDLTPDFTAAADFRTQTGSGMIIGSKTRVGAGAEFRGLKVLQLRGGVAKITGGAELAGGASLVLGPVNLSVAGAKLTGDADAQVAQFTLSFGGR
jgi:hypothetical protein